ncbi:hypothetical protein Glove_441g110 [Diversispora epigaea]|uniref:Uncharacterized protein n=1 Tax=Diversispora epigaea TaxID=1348612 RepID=A0A397GTE0_9GLOM|nr:hypothetical protein Glove_441g110 [Diversispora epigaea]
MSREYLCTAAIAATSIAKASIVDRIIGGLPVLMPLQTPISADKHAGATLAFMNSLIIQLIEVVVK